MVKILENKIFDSTLKEAINTIISLSLNDYNKTPKLLSATGAHGLITAKQNNNFREILNSFYINLPDGMPNVWIGRLKGAKDMERCYGPDFFRETMIASRDKKLNHYFCGGKEGVAEELKKVCEEKFKNRNIVGTFSPPFREMSEDDLSELGNEINKSNADIVWIGLSTPKQEILAYRLSKYTNVHFICTIGAAFDFHTGRVKQAPKWIQNIGMEWFFRLIMEPKRLWKRYFEIVPLFIYYNLIEFLKGDFYSKN